MPDMNRFNEYLTLADQLTNVASKEDLAECARLLAINIAHYESKYGQLPLDETLAMACADKPNDEQIKLLTSGLEALVGVLGSVFKGFDGKVSH